MTKKSSKPNSSENVSKLQTVLSQKVEMEEELNRIIKEKNTLWSAIPDLIFIINSKYKIINFKAERENELIIPPEAVIGKGVNDLPLEKSVKKQFNQAFIKSRKSKEIQYVNYKAITLDGVGYFEARICPMDGGYFLVIIRNRTIEENSKNILLENEKVLKQKSDEIATQNDEYIATNEELVEKNQTITKMMAEMRWNESRIQQIFSSSPAGIFNYNKDLIITELNASFSKVLSIPYSILKGLDLNTIKDKRIIPAIKSSLKGKTGNYLGYYITTHGGKEIYGKLLTQPVFNPENPKEIIGGTGVLEDFTEWKKAQDKLAEKEENLRVTLQSIGDCVIVTDIDGRITALNSVAEKLIGVKSKNAIGKLTKELIKLFNTKTGEQFFCPVEIAIKEKRILSLTKNTEMRPVSGFSYQVTYCAAPIYKSKDEIIGSVVVFQDITENFKIQNELFESESRFRSFFENSPTGNALIDINGNIVEVNNKIIDILGSPSAAATKRINILKFEPLIKSGFTQDFQKCLKTGKSISRQSKYVTKWSKEIDVQYTLSPFVEKNKKITGVVLNIFDITAQKKSEENEKRRLIELQLISKYALELVDLSLEEDIFFFIGDKLKQLIPSHVIVVSRRNPENKKYNIEFVFADEEKHKQFEQIFNKKPQEVKSNPDVNIHHRNKFVEIDPELVFLASGNFDPKGVKRIIQEQSINKAYLFGLYAGEEYVGSVLIFTFKEDILSNIEIIETFLTQVSLQIQKRIALQKLHDSEELYNTTLNSVSEFIHVTDCNHNVIFANTSLQNVIKSIGIHGNIIGFPLRKALPFLRQDIESTYKEVIKTGKPRYSEETNVLNERTFHTQTIITPVFENGKVTRLITSVRDVTQNKLSEFEISVLKELNESIVQNMNEGICMEDSNGNIVMANPAFCKMLEMERDELIGKPAKSLIPRHLHKKIDIAKNNFQIYRNHSFEINITTKTQKSFTALHSFVPIFHSGKLQNIVSVFVDISKRKAMEQDLIAAKERVEESEERFRTMFETANDGILVADAVTKKFILANPQMSDLTGYSYEELLNLTVNDIHPDNEIKNVLDKFEKQINKEIRLADNLPVLKKNGEIVYCDINSSPIEVGGKKYLLGFFRDITNRKLAEFKLVQSKEKIEASEKKFRELYEKSGDAILILRDGLFDDCNKATVELFKYKSKEEILKLHPSEISPEFQPDGINSFEKAEVMMNTALEKGTYRFEWNHQRSDKTVFPAEVLLTAISNEKNLKIIHAVVRDITDRKMTESEIIKTKEKIEESEERFRSAFEYAAYGIVLVSLEGRFLKANNSMCKMLGYSEEELLSKTFSDITYPDDIKIGMEYSKELINGKRKYFWLEKRYIHKNGNIIWGLVSVSAIVNSEGCVSYTVAQIQDITEQKRIDDALITSENRLQLISGLTSDYIFQLDINSNGRIKMTYVSENFKKITGRTIEEVDNPENWTKLFHPNDISEVKRLLQLVISTGNTQELECRTFVKSGHMRWVVILAKAKFDEKKKRVVAVVGSVKDITDRKNSEEQIINALKRAEESDKLKSAFLANMSHELRTPINGIIGFSNLLLDQKLSTDKKERYVSQINASSSMLMRLIEDIIDIAKIESGKLEIEKSACNVPNILDELYQYYKQELTARNKENVLLIYNKFKNNKLTIISDPFRLRQVLINLLSNAVKFTEIGKIEFGCIQRDDKLLFYVKDTGIGIKKESLTKIFDRFTQLEISHSRKFGGTGLGLTISKNIIELLGGEIWVESELQKGSSFFFTIPAEIVSSAESEQIENEFDIVNYSWPGKTILIAEDDDINFMFLEEMLQQTNVKIIRARNGKEAVDLVNMVSEISLVLMDIQMPEMDGYESTKIIKTIRPELPVIAQTAYAFASEKELSINAGCIDYITKPINQKLLLQKINKYSNDK